MEVISKPCLRTPQNQTALIRSAKTKPFFNTSVIIQQGSSAPARTSERSIVSSVTIGTILSLTRSLRGWLDLHGHLARAHRLVGPLRPRTGGQNHGVKTSGTTAPTSKPNRPRPCPRRDGNTGVPEAYHTTVARNLYKIPLPARSPLLGKLPTGTFDYKEKQELVIFVTPRVVPEEEPSAKLPPQVVQPPRLIVP